MKTETSSWHFQSIYFISTSSLIIQVLINRWINLCYYDIIFFIDTQSDSNSLGNIVWVPLKVKLLTLVSRFVSFATRREEAHSYIAQRSEVRGIIIKKNESIVLETDIKSLLKLFPRETLLTALKVLRDFRIPNDTYIPVSFFRSRIVAWNIFYWKFHHVCSRWPTIFTLKLIVFERFFSSHIYVWHSCACNTLEYLFSIPSKQSLLIKIKLYNLWVLR